jgi:hypothetical protein
MADDDFDLYGEDDGFSSNPPSQVQVGLMLFVARFQVLELIKSRKGRSSG